MGKKNAMAKNYRKDPPGQRQNKRKTHARLKRALLLLAFNLVVIALLLYLAEALLWLRDPARKLGRDGLVDDVLYTWGYPVQKNEHGFRDRNFAVPKPQDVFRIMILGDSFIWGVGLPVEKRLTNQLERILSDRYPDTRIEVLNFGLMGGPTVEEAKILDEYRGIVEPDLVVIGFCLNDTQPRSQDYSVERKEYDLKYAFCVRAIAILLDRVHIRRVGRNLVKMTYRVAEVAGIIPTWQVALGRTYRLDCAEWVAFVESLRQIKASCDEMQLPAPVFAVLNQGTSTLVPTDYAHPDDELSLYLDWCHQAEQAAQRAGFTTCNFEKEFATELSADIMAINQLDAHPSEKMNAIYARKLGDIIAPVLDKRP